VPSVVAHEWLAISGIAVGMKSPGSVDYFYISTLIAEKGGILTHYENLSYE
jgi:hypothetical protein